MNVIDFWTEVLAPHIHALQGESWRAWKTALKALFALPMSDDELVTYRQCTGREDPPVEPAREGWFVVGRRGGKSYVMALVAVYLATVRKYKLAPGERGVVMLIASDRKQARVLRRYVGALFEHVPMLGRMVVNERREAIELNNGIDIEIHTASFKSVRGYSVVGAICDEAAFWSAEDGANPDREVINALLPAMATTGGLLVCISSPHARRGVMFDAYRDIWGADGGGRLCWVADTATMNPQIDQAVIDRAFEQDDVTAWSEYGRDGEIRFRSDVETFVTQEAVDRCTVADRIELPPSSQLTYKGFVDFAGGSGADSATLAIAHCDVRGDAPRPGDRDRFLVLDALREVRPPFDPEETCRQFATLLKSYRIREAQADRYAGDWPVQQMSKCGIRLIPAKKSKSEIYVEMLPALNAGRVELLDNARLRAQLTGLERRVGRSGKESVDHRSGGHDDIANAACGALLSVGAHRPSTGVTVYDFVWGYGPTRVSHGIDGDGNEWRNGTPWNGLFIVKDSFGRPRTEAIYRDGSLIQGRRLGRQAPEGAPNQTKEK